MPNIKSARPQASQLETKIMTDINVVTLMGRLVRDPQLYPRENGIGLALFTIASNRDYKDRDGKTQTETAYVPCKAFGGWASALSGRQKGDLLILSGRLKSDSWEKDGTVHWQLSLVCQMIHAVTHVPKAGSTTNPKNDDDGDGDGEAPF